MGSIFFIFYESGTFEESLKAGMSESDKEILN